MPAPIPVRAAPGVDKPALRRWAITRRAELDLPRLSAALREALVSLCAWGDARHVLLYVPLVHEVDLLPLAEDPKKHWYLPRCAPNRRLTIHPYRPGQTPLLPGPFGLREPDPASGEVDPGCLDLVVAPALLLSERGERLGHGAGYYDRFLPRLSPACVTVGALPAALVLPALPADPWDIPLDLVLRAD